MIAARTKKAPGVKCSRIIPLQRAAPGGSGGGGGKSGGAGRSAHEADDTLRSKAEAYGVDLISEGEIVGPYNAADGEQSLFLDGTPLRNPDGSRNFSAYDFFFLPGVQDQSYIEGFAGAETPNNVNLQIKATGPVNWTQHITDSTLNYVVVTMQIPVLRKQNTTNGDINGTTVSYKLQLQTNGGGFVDQVTEVLNGKASTPYQRSYRIPLPASTNWDVRAVRITADSTLSSLQNDTVVATYSTGIDGKFRYPNSAICAWRVDAEQFSRIPVRSYDFRGLKVQIPDNYNPITRQYTGVWGGSFVTAWTDNPAWCWYALATNTRWGLGQKIPTGEVDKFALYTIAQYSDGYVKTGIGRRATLTTGSISMAAVAPNQYTRAAGSFVTDGFQVGDEITATGFATSGNNGRGVITAVAALTLTLDVDHVLTADGAGAGRTLATQDPTEPRFTCNLYIQTREEALKVLGDMASIFRGMAYYGAGLVVPVQDSPSSPVATFALANVIDGQFSFQGSAGRARHNAAIVSWNDLSDQGALKYELVEDQISIAKSGRNELSVAGFGCASRGQAFRWGRWALLTEQVENETVTFRVAIEGMIVAPGAVIQTQIPWRQGRVLSGRVSKLAGAVDLGKPITDDLGNPITDDFGQPLTTDN